MYIENMFMMFCFDSQMFLLLIWYLVCIHTTNIRKKYFYFKLRFPKRLTLVLFLNLDAADFIHKCMYDKSRIYVNGTILLTYTNVCAQVSVLNEYSKDAVNIRSCHQTTVFEDKIDEII